MSLITIHPNTDEYILEIATHWSIDKNKRTVYYKLDPKAKG